MPTAGRLAAALLFAALAWAASQAVRPLLPEGTQLGQFDWINAAIGAVAGWRVMGPRAGEGPRAAVGMGLSTSAAMVAIALLIHCGTIMIRRSMSLRYDDAVEALAAVFELVAEHAILIAAPHVVLILALGGILAGLLADLAGRRWA